MEKVKCSRTGIRYLLTLSCSLATFIMVLMGFVAAAGR